mmetsp:Transcript_24357/g.62223  ORF Transcript_24357/g.62223 Transcript_24357/m.62223 type:complete len:202 (+) Transcript_24357:137-742(+)
MMCSVRFAVLTTSALMASAAPISMISTTSNSSTSDSIIGASPSQTPLQNVQVEKGKLHAQLPDSSPEDVQHISSATSNSSTSDSVTGANASQTPLHSVQVEKGKLHAQLPDSSPEDVQHISNGTASSCADVRIKGLCSHPLAKSHCAKACADELNNGEVGVWRSFKTAAGKCSVGYTCSPGNCYGSSGCDCPGSCCTISHC